jgi:hypothetical protein
MEDRPHRRYRRVFFDEEWLEDWILSILETTFDSLFSKSEFSRDKSKRAVAFWAMAKYAGLSNAEICRRYGQHNSTVSNLITSVRNNNFASDRMKVSKSLEPYIPTRQSNEMYKQE